MKRKPLSLSHIVALPLLALAAQPAHAWWPQGHSIIAEAAIRALSEKDAVTPIFKTDPVPGYFRDGTGLVAHTAQDPDTLKNAGLPHITDRETAEHFLDVELLKGRTLPETRSEYVKLCAQMKLDPAKVGYAPYAIAEWTERLTMAFAEHRRYPKNPYIKNKSMVYAGILAHYAGDLCMPLHTTVDYDGRTLQDGSSSRTGIHEKVDALIERLSLQPKELAKGQKIGPLPALIPGIVAELEESHSHVEETYALEKSLPTGRVSVPQSNVVAYTTERAREATRFTAALFLTAWRDSAKVQLPDWLEREK